MDKEPNQTCSVQIEVFLESDMVDIDVPRFVHTGDALVESEGGHNLSGVVRCVFSDHERVTQLNRQFLDHDFDTDVLSFRLDDGDTEIDAEIYVDVETALTRCSEFGTSAEDEAIRYAIHGLLHLFGYEDKTESGVKKMKVREQQFLDLWRKNG